MLLMTEAFKLSFSLVFLSRGKLQSEKSKHFSLIGPFFLLTNVTLVKFGIIAKIDWSVPQRCLNNEPFHNLFADFSFLCFDCFITVAVVQKLQVVPRYILEWKVYNRWRIIVSGPRQVGLFSILIGHKLWWIGNDKISVGSICIQYHCIFMAFFTASPKLS